MNRQEILEEINKTKEHLSNMEKMLGKRAYERWKPETGTMYYFIDSDGDIIHACFDWRLPHCQDRYNIYNCFKTREEAEQEAEKILIRRQLEDIARRLNKGEKNDWKNEHQAKYSLYLDFNEDELFSTPSYTVQKRCGAIYCLSHNFKDVAIQEISEERLKKYLRSE